MLHSNQKEELKDKVYRLLDEVGMVVENEQIAGAMVKCGCREDSSGRVRISRGLIEEMAKYQKASQSDDESDQQLHEHCGIDWAHHIIWNKQQGATRERLKNEFLMSAFDCGPTKYYDYARGELSPIDTAIFTEIKKLAQVSPEIGYISTWYRQDVPAKIERIDSLILGLQYTNKLDGIEAIYPEVIKYLKEISEIITGRAGDSSYLAGSECITSPLILEGRSAEDIVERKNCGIHRYHVASMPTIGVSTPVTVAGSVVMMAAEILGGMAACYAFDPESDLSGRAIALAADMKTSNNTASTPEVTAANFCVRELFDEFWGGHLWVEVYQSPATARPGLQAVYDNFCGGWRTAKMLNRSDIPYPGMGTLGCGGTGSPTQLMLDMEIRKSQCALKDGIVIDEEQLPFDGICRAVQENATFMANDHTLDHFRELWSSPVFITETMSAVNGGGDEKSLLDRCETMWRERLREYEPPVWPADKMKDLESLLERAKKELLR